MKRYSFLPHTADIRMEVEASTLEDLFITAVHGMNSVLYEEDGSEPGGEEEISVEIALEAPDTTVLLIDFLSDVLTCSYDKICIFYDIKFDHISARRLQAKLTGHPIRTFHEDIKAVTYHEAEVEKNAAGNWYTKIIFDI